MKYIYNWHKNFFYCSYYLKLLSLSNKALTGWRKERSPCSYISCKCAYDMCNVRRNNRSLKADISFWEEEGDSYCISWTQRNKLQKQSCQEGTWNTHTWLSTHMCLCVYQNTFIWHRNIVSCKITNRCTFLYFKNCNKALNKR